MDTEVKKRGAIRIATDVSYKEAKHLAKYHSESLFSGLFTTLNEIDEVRVQHHVVTDEHDQLERPLVEMNKTLVAYGQQQTIFVATDKPAEDKAFYQRVLPGVHALQQKLDNNHRADDGDDRSSSFFQLIDRSAQVTVVETEAAINTKVLAMRNAIAEGPEVDRKFSLDGAPASLWCARVCVCNVPVMQCRDAMP